MNNENKVTARSLMVYRNPFSCGINTCHAATLLRKDHLEHLAFVKAYTGVRSVRCHGIFHDRIGVASVLDEQGAGAPGFEEPIARGGAGGIQFHFGQAHKVYDNLLELGLTPWVELSFLPRILAADPSKTICWYQAYCSNPTSYKVWGQLVEAFAKSLLRRYGTKRLAQWHFEVWNEPNIIFWQVPGDKFAEYMKLYAAAARAMKSAHRSLQVGGPVTARGEWIGKFIDETRRRRLPVDFISTHLYPADEYEVHGNTVREKFGPFDYYPQTILGVNDLVRRKLSGVAVYWNETNATHHAMEKDDTTGKYASWELFAGEATWGKRTVDETPQSGAYAALLAGTMLRHDVNLFWWTASDVYEEWQPDVRPYHGGRGLVNLWGIPKPIAHALHFAHRMDGGTILDTQVDGGAGYLAVRKAGRRLVLGWNYAHPELPPAPARLTLRRGIGNCPCMAKITLVDQTHANGHYRWQELGSPLELDAAVCKKVLAASQLKTATLRLDAQGRLTLPPNSFALVEF